jgi:hypothetical protein
MRQEERLRANGYASVEALSHHCFWNLRSGRIDGSPRSRLGDRSPFSYFLRFLLNAFTGLGCGGLIAALVPTTGRRGGFSNDLLKGLHRLSRHRLHLPPADPYSDYHRPASSASVSHMAANSGPCRHERWKAGTEISSRRALTSIKGRARPFRLHLGACSSSQRASVCRPSLWSE